MAKQALISDILDFRAQRENVKSESFSNLLDKETGNQGSELLKTVKVLSLRAVTGILESYLNLSLSFYPQMVLLLPYFIIFTTQSKIFLFVLRSCFMHVLVTFLIAVPKRENFRKERFTLTHCSKGAVFQGRMAREFGIALCVAAGALTMWLVRSHRLKSEELCLKWCWTIFLQVCSHPTPATHILQPGLASKRFHDFPKQNLQLGTQYSNT